MCRQKKYPFLVKKGSTQIKRVCKLCKPILKARESELDHNLLGGTEADGAYRKKLCQAQDRGIDGDNTSILPLSITLSCVSCSFLQYATLTPTSPNDDFNEADGAWERGWGGETNNPITATPILLLGLTNYRANNARYTASVQ